MELPSPSHYKLELLKEDFFSFFFFGDEKIKIARVMAFPFHGALLRLVFRLFKQLIIGLIIHNLPAITDVMVLFHAVY